MTNVLQYTTSVFWITDNGVNEMTIFLSGLAIFKNTGMPNKSLFSIPLHKSKLHKPSFFQVAGTLCVLQDSRLPK